MLKDDLTSAITHAKALFIKELYPIMAEMSFTVCLLLKGNQNNMEKNILGNLTIDD